MNDKSGNIDDVVLGYDNFSDYQTKDAYLGALVGRTANRIGKGVFTLNGTTYHLPINNGPNCLHGGIKLLNLVIYLKMAKKVILVIYLLKHIIL